MNKLQVVCILLAITAINSKSLEDPTIVQEIQKESEVSSDKLVEIPHEEETKSRQSRKRVTSLNDALNCGFDVACFLENIHAVLEDRKQIILAEADARYMSSSVARAQSNESPSELTQTVEGIITEMTDIVKDTVSNWLKGIKINEDLTEQTEILPENGGAETEEEEIQNQGISEEGRAKKKKKLRSLMKLLILGAVLKAKLTVLLQLLSAALQIKFFFIALAGLLINKIRLWYDLKKGHQPQKVIYYEHAQHQHHYDHLDDDHHGGGFWGRAYEVPEDEEEDSSAQNMAYRGQRPIPWSPQQH